MKPIQVQIRKIKNRILNSAAEVAHYKNWNDEYSRKSINEACSADGSTFLHPIDKLALDDLRTLTREELYDVGFTNWDDTMLLIPLWMKHFIEEDEIVTSINGHSCHLWEADTDNRRGMMAYGFYLGEDNG